MKKLEPEVIAEFTDRFGDDRQVIRRRSGRHLAVKRQRDSTCHAMMRVIGIHIGKRIREERQKKGMTAADLCRKAGLQSVSPKQRMYEIEVSMRYGVKLGTLYAIAAALEVDPLSLLPSLSSVMEQAGVSLSPTRVLSLQAEGEANG